jgi:SAM-dependent methyltransferase
VQAHPEAHGEPAVRALLVGARRVRAQPAELEIVHHDAHEHRLGVVLIEHPAGDLFAVAALDEPSDGHAPGSMAQACALASGKSSHGAASWGTLTPPGGRARLPRVDAATWQAALQEELLFWRRWMTEERFRNAREPRLRPDAGFPQWLRPLVAAPEGILRVLDVGSGPLSTLGTGYPGRTVELTLVDPLAKDYNALLEESGLGARAVLVEGTGETLDALFPADRFDLVHAANALDHAHDPLRCLQNMMHVCKPGGAVVFISVENEGERQHYGGLHQWNFSIQGEHLRLWNREQDLVVHEHLEGVARLEVRPVDHGNGLPMLLATFRKRGP